MKRNPVLVTLVLNLMVASAFAQEEKESQLPESPSGHLQFATIHTDGEHVQRVDTIEVTHKEMIENRIGMTGLQVILLPSNRSDELGEHWKSILAEDILLMKFPTPKADEENSR